MGREKKILLGFLGLLAGVFVGVLSVKLLVPRPPTGTGPDIRPEVTTTTAQERVEPPTPSPGGWDFSVAPPLVPDAPPADAAPLPAEPPRFSRFGAAAPPPEPPAAPPATPPAPATVDDAVAPVSWQRSEPAVELHESGPPPAIAAVATPAPAPPVAGVYTVRPGDSWWDLAERAYGDGRIYRALFAWNRSRDPRVSLAPGTRLDVPQISRLQAAWPRLVPPAGRD